MNDLVVNMGDDRWRIGSCISALEFSFKTCCYIYKLTTITLVENNCYISSETFSSVVKFTL